MKRVIALFFCLILTVSCAPQPTETSQFVPTTPSSATDEAQRTLVKFFDLLNSKQYTEADTLYGGDYELMQTWNPDINPSDHVQLWEHACEWNGLMCLEARTATLSEQQGDTFIFQVEFSNPDGSLFVQGPCCGASEEEMPPVSQFEYLVDKTAEGTFLVLTLPPYVP